jgi:SOS-response transcriptional repressor LexA
LTPLIARKRKDVLMLIENCTNKYVMAKIHGEKSHQHVRHSPREVNKRFHLDCLNTKPTAMPTKTRLAEIYLRFLQLRETIRELPSLPPLDPLEECILSWIAKASLEQSRISVRGMMVLAEFGSPATIHSRLKSMRRKGWIVLVDTEDARRKQIELTQAALLYFDQLSDCMLQAAQDS